MKPNLRIALVLLLTLLSIGCGGRRSNITGTITRDGKPLVWEKDEGHLLVLFVPEEWTSRSQVYSVEADRATGTYVIPEIRSGRYLVAIHQFDDRHQDALNNKFDPSNSPLRFEVMEDNQVIDIDLPKELPR